jgi:hypothetical protein
VRGLVTLFIESSSYIGSKGERIVNINGTVIIIQLCLFDKSKVTDIRIYTSSRGRGKSTKSLTDYNIINEKLRTAIREIRVFGGSEIDTNLYLLQSAFIMHKKYYIRERNMMFTNSDRTLKTVTERRKQPKVTWK